MLQRAMRSVSNLTLSNPGRLRSPGCTAAKRLVLIGTLPLYDGMRLTVMRRAFGGRESLQADDDLLEQATIREAFRYDSSCSFCEKRGLIRLSWHTVLKQLTWDDQQPKK